MREVLCNLKWVGRRRGVEWERGEVVGRSPIRAEGNQQACTETHI